MERQPMRVLVVDDDADIVRVVGHALGAAGALVHALSDGAEALETIRRWQPDLVLLDLELPGRHGLDVCRAVRHDPSIAHTPIVMMTGLVGEADRIGGLEAGADDYVVKPFSARELVLRVKAVLRRARAAGQDQPPQRVGAIELNPARRRVRVEGREVALPAKEFDLLAALMAARGRVLSRDDLLRRVWGYTQGFEGVTRTVDVHVAWLRQKIEPNPAETRLLVTEAGGYRLEQLEDAGAG